jgi:mucin-19
MNSQTNWWRLLAPLCLFVPTATVLTLTSSNVAHAAACTPTSSIVGTDTVLTFSTVGSCTWSVPADVTNVRALVIGGGGGGGKSTNVGGSGGGGAGAMVVHSSYAVSGTISVVVGAGGATLNRFDQGNAGASSSLAALVAIGGGGGGDWCDSGCTESNYPRPPRPQIPGASGGSGGGSGGGLSNSVGGEVAAQTLPSGAVSYGNRGGNAVSGANYHGSGGGGAGQAGANRTSSSMLPTAGGIGRTSNITGSDVYYAAGGGGSGGATNNWAAGGEGGGGNGGGRNNNPVATAGANGKGSGGGGGQNGPGAAGGSGIVIVRFATVPVNTVLPAITGTLQTEDELTATNGTWSGAPTSYSIRWKRSSTLGGTYTTIGSLVTSSYTLQDSDVGDYFLVEITATNVNGSGTPVESNPVGPVTDIPTNPTPTLGSPTSTNTGFTFSITNYSATYTYLFTATSGSASQSSGLVTVTGLSAGESSSIVVRATRSGYRSASATLTSSARAAATTTTTAPPVLEIVLSATTTTIVRANENENENVVTPATTPITTTPALRPTATTPRTVATTTTTTMPKSPVGSTLPPAPKIPSVGAGEAGVKVGDSTKPATVTRVDNELFVSAGPIQASLAAIDETGKITALDGDGNVRLKTGDKIRIKLSGFEPGSTVEAWLFSVPILMGTAKVKTDGTVTGLFTIPKDAPKGAHRIAVVTKTSDGKPATLTVGVMVGDWDGGTNVALWLISLPIVFAVLGALLLPATRRQLRLGTKREPSN